jgi:EAL domain-containing protein (putative c-di-GMP-specific phosphodiesterase class I)
MSDRRSTLLLHDPAVADVVETGDFDLFLSPEHLKAAYQPIVDLSTGSIVAFEALARWPGLAGAMPDAVFAAARLNGRTAELDWACRLAALEGALEFGLSREHVLFVNVEPEALRSPPPSRAAAILDAAQRDLRVILELTERSLARRPAALLRVVEWARLNGWGIALDDVGAEPASLALLPFLAPDVIKLDMSLVRTRATPDQAMIMAAVMSHSERTGAVVLAEGIETSSHLDQALALGATLGQGWAIGRPGPLIASPTPVPAIALARAAPTVALTPFETVSHLDGIRVGRKGLLHDLSRHIERQGQHLNPAPVVISAFQTADRFTPATAIRYRKLAQRCPLVAALGVGLKSDQASRVRAVSFAADDPLAKEWTVTTIGSHYAAALVARDLGDSGPDDDRRFEFVVTHDREIVLAAARSLMSRLIPAERFDE